jgi:hypothetical protein
LQEEGQDLKVSLKPLSKQGQDIRRMFNGPKRTAASGAETISSQQDMPKLQGEANKVAKRMAPCKVESEEETPLFNCKTVRPEKSDSDETKAPAPPLKRKRGRPKKSDSSGIKEAAENGELPGKAAEMGSGRPHRICRDSKPLIEDENEEVDKSNPAAEDDRKSQKRGSKEKIPEGVVKVEDSGLPSGWTRFCKISTTVGQHHQYFIKTPRGKFLR